ncbi:polysaccharide lyase 8 family protein [Flavobacterium faecale]|uniref:polysaccharide lyase 8 family protein n=1 Tax=Flavobacterium faecale TaxID=1355330 RepID=UPI003AB02529
MKNKIFLFLFLVAMKTSAIKAQETPTYPNELKQFRDNVISDFLKDPVTEKSAVKLISAIDEKGRWENIDYTSTRRSAWPVLGHLNNLQVLIKAYRTKSSSFYNDKALSQKIKLALNYYLDNDFQSDNWWYSQIGSPNKLSPILVTMEDEMTPEQLAKAIKLMSRAKIGMTGQNKIWLSGNVMIKSLLLRNIDSVAIASNTIKNELKVTAGEGIQQDASYHQHGKQLQFGNYGMHYLEDMVKWMAILKGTPFAFDQEKIVILRDYVLNGQQWVFYKKAMDISGCGRQLFRGAPEAKKDTMRYQMKHLALIDTDFAKQYEDVNDYSKTNGDKFFWRSDFHVNRTPNYYFSVKTCSSRVLGAESANSENLLGYYMGDGVTFLYQTQEEYQDIFPFWDWKKLPGTTLKQDDKPLPVLTAKGYSIDSDFVGGVSDGQNGISVMCYNRDGLQANKSWFMFNNKIICLGNGIKTSEKVAVATTINQTYLKGQVVVKTKKGVKNLLGNQIIDNPNWILHDNVGYIFPNGGKLNLEAQTVEGSWSRVAASYPDEKIKAKIFKLWLDHEVQPTNGNYAYIMVPNADKEILAKMEKKSEFEIQNNLDYQSVITKDGELMGIVFYKASKVPFLGGIEVDSPCVMMIEKSGKEVTISLADPTHQLGEIVVTLSGKYIAENAISKNGITKVKAELPKKLYAGSAAKIVFEIK